MAMDQSNINKYKNLFLKAGGNYIADMEKQAAELAENPQSEAAREKLFIDSHSLSSETNMMAYTSMEKFCKTLNLAIRASKENSAPLSESVVTAIIEGVAQLRKSHDALASGKRELDLSEATTKLEEAAGVTV